MRHLQVLAAALAAVSSILLAPAVVRCEDDLEVLGMYYEEKDLVVSATRGPKPVSQIAENLAVVTAEEIEAMNAHTVAEVLATVPGLQVDLRGGPGSTATFLIQGAVFRHILVMIDGVTLNNLTDNFADVGALPVQNIERIEIIKGPASSWGSGLGGVVNIITKSPPEDRVAAATSYVSLGERETRDLRGEIGGTAGSFGYYLFAGKLSSEGLRSFNAVDGENFYGKARWGLRNRGSLRFTLGYNGGSREEFRSPLVDLSSENEYRYIYSTLGLDYRLANRLFLDTSLRFSARDTDILFRQLSTGIRVTTATEEPSMGGSAKLHWRPHGHSVGIGFDFDHVDLHLSSRNPGGETNLDRDTSRWGIFANDTIALGSGALTPEVRFDRTNVNGDFFSTSLGLTWPLGERTTIRGYAGRGFSLPSLLPGEGIEKVFALQAGVETTELRYLWLKGTLFYNRIYDIAADSGNETDLRQGIELEMKTVPVFNTTFSAGGMFLDARNAETDDILQGIPRYSVNIGIQYNDKRAWRGTITGRYVWWNSPEFLHGRYGAFVWDATAERKISVSSLGEGDIFLSVRNIFDTSQYADELLQNPPRWFEGGVRFRF